MKRTLVACVAALACAGVTSATASAKTIEVGQTATPIAPPVCPTGVSQVNCLIVVPKYTVLQTLSDGTSFPTTITKPGLISALTLGVSGLSTNATQVKGDINFLETKYGGTPSAQVTILRPVGLPGKNRWRVAAQSEVIQLLPYLGKVAQFPMTVPLPVVPGEVVALTVPTWAPILGIDMSPASKFSYRQANTQSQVTNKQACKTVSTAQLVIGQLSSYGCRYTGTRVEYSATEILTPTGAN